jgi:hypothetical protein
VSVADVNGDGKPDIVATTLTGVSVLLGNGDGTFQAPRNFDVGSGLLSVAVADVNGDGKPDLIVGDSVGESVLLGNGDGTFQKPLTFTIGNGITGGVAVVDVNGDGKPDLVTANSGKGTVSVLLGNGDGTFQTPPPPLGFSVGIDPTLVALADVNGDGIPDIVTANADDNTVSVLLGNGDGTFQNQQTFPVGPQPASVAVADVNGDGKLDIVTANYLDNTVSVLLGNGDGTFQKPKTFPVDGRPVSVVVADVNGDGKPDIITANFDSGTVSVLLGNGDGTFQPAKSFPVGDEPWMVTVADVNGDGKPDIVTANRPYFSSVSGALIGNNSVGVLLGNGDGTFGSSQTFQVGPFPLSVAVADVNGDGKPDIVTANQHYDGNKVSVLLGNGDGTFQKPRTFAVGPSSGSVAVADVNGDGKPDIVVTNQATYDPTTGRNDNGGGLSVLPGKGDGTFGAPQPSTPAPLSARWR